MPVSSKLAQDIIDDELARTELRERREKAMFGIGEAIDHLKDGERVARAGWNGKGMWLVLVPANRWEIMQRDAGNRLSAAEDAAARSPWVAMYTADDHLVPWLASQTDLLATDWEVVA